MRCVLARRSAGKACDASHSGAMRKECNAASAPSGKNPEGTDYLGVLRRCAACQGSHPWLRDAPCTTSQIVAFALMEDGEMSFVHAVSLFWFVSDGLDFYEQVRVRQLMNRHRRACGAIVIEVFPVYLVITAEVVHVDEESRDFNDVRQLGADAMQDAADILDHGACLRFDVEFGGAHLVDFHSFETVVGAARAGPGNEQEIAGALDVREFTARQRLSFDQLGLGVERELIHHCFPVKNSTRPRPPMSVLTCKPGRRASAAVAAPAMISEPAGSDISAAASNCDACTMLRSGLPRMAPVLPSWTAWPLKRMATPRLLSERKSFTLSENAPTIRPADEQLSATTSSSVNLKLR